MHPIERLRFVARAVGVPGDVLAVEATAALMTFVDEPAALVAGCRRVLARQVSCGPLWWACARLLTAESVRDTAIETIRMLEGDTTSAALSLALDTGESPRPTIERALAIGESAAIVSRTANPEADDLDRTRGSGTGGGQRWLVGGVGVQLAEPMWAALCDNWNSEPRADEELVALEDVTHVVGPLGAVPVAGLGPPDCPVAPELFRLSG